MFCASLLYRFFPGSPQKDEFLRLVINSVRNDLISRNEAFQCLALDFIANGAVAGQGWPAWRAGRGMCGRQRGP